MLLVRVALLGTQLLLKLARPAHGKESGARWGGLIAPIVDTRASRRRLNGMGGWRCGDQNRNGLLV